MVIDNPGSAAFGAVAAYGVWDFTRSMFSKVVGRHHEVDSPFVDRIQIQRESDLDSLNEAITAPIRNAHRFIGFDDSPKTITLSVAEEDSVTLNIRTRDYLFIRRLEERPLDFVGNISSYNIHRKTGRIFDMALGRTVPFVFDSIGKKTADTGPITWSIDQNNRGLPGHISLRGCREVTVDDVVVRYVVRSCQRI